MSEFNVSWATTLNLKGAITENAEIPANLDLSGGKPLLVNWDQVTYINSAGTLKWVNWIKNIISQNNGTEIFYINCPPAIVELINIVKDALPSSCKVLSFYIPYYCENCDSQENVKVGNDPIAENCQQPTSDQIELQGKTCKKCSRHLEPDIVENNYFKFLKR